MSGLRQMSGMQPVMSPREQPRGRHPGSWPRGLPSLDGTIRKAPRHPGQPDKEAQCSPCDTGHGPPRAGTAPQSSHSPGTRMPGCECVVLVCASLWQPPSLSPMDGGVLSPGASCFTLSLFQSFSPSSNTSSRHR